MAKNKSTLTDKDFYYDSNGNMVFTESYHRKRGFCCKSGCRHCPFDFGQGVDCQTPVELLCAKETEEIKDDSYLIDLAESLMAEYESQD